MRIMGRDKAVEAGAVEAVQASGRHALVVNTQSVHQDQIWELLSSGVYGVLASHRFALSTSGQKLLAGLAERNVPFVVHGDHAALSRYDRIISDHD